MGMRMSLLRIGILAGLLAPGLRGDAPAPTAQAAKTSAPSATAEATRLPELIQVLRTHLGLEAAEFETRASRALIDHFGAQRMDGAGASGTERSQGQDATAAPVARRERLEGGVLYLKVGQVSDGLPAALKAALTDAAWITNASGLVVDLRFTSGDSLPAAGRSAALFSERTEAVLRWDATSVSGSGTERVWTLPLAVLVNGRTGGAAEALAAVLRQETGGALVGQATAGTHGVYREVPLADGSRLRIPSGRLRLGDGSVLAAGPIAPDIRVPVAEAAERAFVENPVATVKPAGPNGSASGRSATRRKVTEADLVRAQRIEPAETEGRSPSPAAGDPTSETTPGARSPATLRLADPVLGRAADLVRGLAAFRKSNP